ncbi:MAG: DUF3343 domain-containing protein [Clostridiales bacterium]|nr:DUF3343 domain-containing protein [Clostridiales bacterium]
MSSSKAIAIFRSRSYAMLFHSEMKGRGIVCEIAPAPSKLAMGCGVAVLLDIKDVQAVLRYNEANKYRIIGIFGITGNKENAYERLY